MSDMVLADIWDDRPKMSATEQLFALACLQTGFKDWATADYDSSREEYLPTISDSVNLSQESKEADDENEANKAAYLLEKYS